MVYISTPEGRMNVRTKFLDAKELRKKVDAFFADCDKRKVAYTMAGLALALRTTRATLMDYEYEGEDDEISEIIWEAKARCERWVEEMLLSGKNPIGSIFNLKNNYKRWKEETSFEMKGMTSLVALIKTTQPLNQPNEELIESERTLQLPDKNSQ